MALQDQPALTRAVFRALIETMNDALNQHNLQSTHDLGILPYRPLSLQLAKLKNLYGYQQRIA